ncbi:hypothetical protein Sa4125_30310 [Aureimonas sp. SA4125]|uniref:restriction endonuclease n=1 Tax=Aureimonas sp. SA4125 TaxID=2826993 RepID=UPI001CC3F14A|nr:restriction endonuclease [Aureimonas sp. SA4125]BDA85489.1 hypothetical protein Sa4125_30310 [Aureimonas sp. SA4125]
MTEDDDLRPIAYAIFAEKRAALWQWLRTRPLAVPSFVDVTNTLPDRIEIADFDPTGVYTGQAKMRTTLPRTLDLSSATFPVIEVVTAEELMIIGRASAGDDRMTLILGPNASLYKERPDLLFTTLEAAKAYTSVRALNDGMWTIDGENRGLQQIYMRKGAERLFRMCRNYDFFASNEVEIRNLMASNSVTDSFGRVSEHLAWTSLGKLAARRATFEFDDEASFDVGIFLRESAAATPAPSVGDWSNYEADCAAALSEAGFKVAQTRRTGDYGADIVAMKDGLTYVVQCKWAARPTGVSAIQEIGAALRFYTADFAAVVAKSGYTNAAHELARANGVALLDMRSLGDLDRAFGS